MSERIIKRLWKDATFCAAGAVLLDLLFGGRSRCYDGRPAGTGYLLWWAAHDPWFLLTLRFLSLASGFAVTAALCWGVGRRGNAASGTEVVGRG